jgi:uncharacterized protein
MSPAKVTCPTCGRELEWAAAAFRPFCSERCRLVDLGAWLTEQRTIPGENASATTEPTPQESAAKPSRS